MLAERRGVDREGAYAIACAACARAARREPRGGGRGRRVAGLAGGLVRERRGAHRRRWRRDRRRRYARVRAQCLARATRRSRRPVPLVNERRERWPKISAIAPPPRGSDQREQRDAAARARLVGSLSELADVGVRAVRLQYADLHGICRGKLIPISAFPHVAEEGMGFVEAIMTVDLRHNVVAGFEHGFPDFLARPDLNTLVPLPWEEDVVACLVDLEDPVTHEPHPLDCRGALQARARPSSPSSASRRWSGPSSSSTCCEPDASDPRGYASLRRAGQRGLHGRRHGRPEGHARADARRRGRARARRDRGRARVRPQPVRDQPRATAPRSTPPTARSASGRWSRRWRRATGCSRRSWASRSTTTRARASTCTCRSSTRDGANAGEDADGAARADAGRCVTSSPA